MKTQPSRQRGLSLLGWVVVLMVLVVFGTAAFRMIPAYMEYNTISSAITSVLDDNKTALMSPGEVRDSIGKRFLINQVDAINTSDLNIEKDGGQLSVGVDYEVRQPMFYNVFVVMQFDHTFKKNIRQ